jgi:hypothetical protein
MTALEKLKRVCTLHEIAIFRMDDFLASFNRWLLESLAAT